MKTNPFANRLVKDFQEIKENRVELMSSTVDGSEIQSFWDSPNAEWIKVNFDGACDIQGEKTGIGAVTRAEQQCRPSVLVIDAQAALLGMQMAVAINA